MAPVSGCCGDAQFISTSMACPPVQVSGFVKDYDDHPTSSSCSKSISISSNTANSTGKSNGNNHVNYNHHHIQSVKETEDMIAQELTKMSIQEREQAYYDIHGVGSPEGLKEETTPSLQKQACEELENELLQDFNPSTTLMHQVYQEAPDYIQSLYIPFLRADQYNIPSAVARIHRHFEVKEELFGRDKLSRDIQLSDLTKEDRKTLDVGFYQLAPFRDRAGRAIFIKTWYHQWCMERINVWRVFWYIMMIALRDEETQIKGMVALLYNVNPSQHWSHKLDGMLYLGVTKIRNAVPIKLQAAHYAFSDPTFGAVMKLCTETVERASRIRTKLHHGSHVEVQYNFLSYGIPLHVLPINSEGTLSLKEHKKFIKAREIQEKHEQHLNKIEHNINGNNNSNSGNENNNKEGEIVIIPNNNDVLFGPGKPLQNHVGNIGYSAILEKSLIDYYTTSKRKEKSIVVQRVMDEILNNGGRFLKQQTSYKGATIWQVIHEKAFIMDRVGHGFRNRKKPSNAQMAAAAMEAKKKVASSKIGSTIMPSSASSKRRQTPSSPSSLSSRMTATGNAASPASMLPALKQHPGLNAAASPAISKRPRVMITDSENSSGVSDSEDDTLSQYSGQYNQQQQQHLQQQHQQQLLQQQQRMNLSQGSNSGNDSNFLFPSSFQIPEVIFENPF